MIVASSFRSHFVSIISRCLYELVPDMVRVQILLLALVAPLPGVHRQGEAHGRHRQGEARQDLRARHLLLLALVAPCQAFTEGEAPGRHRQGEARQDLRARHLLHLSLGLAGRVSCPAPLLLPPGLLVRSPLPPSRPPASPGPGVPLLLRPPSAPSGSFLPALPLLLGSSARLPPASASSFARPPFLGLCLPPPPGSP